MDDKKPKCSYCDDQKYVNVFYAEDWEQIRPCPYCNKEDKNGR